MRSSEEKGCKQNKKRGNKIEPLSSKFLQSFYNWGQRWPELVRHVITFMFFPHNSYTGKKKYFNCGCFRF